MASVAADPTIRRQVMVAARQVLATEPEAPIERITKRAGISRATFYRHELVQIAVAGLSPA